ncbi:MAG: hypothetical protein WCK26_03400 [Candidatus Saccharibacteria bacterium]
MNHINIQKIIKSTKKLFKTDFGAAFIITAIWKTSMVFIGFIMDISINGSAGLLSHTARWDSGWYMTVIKDSYVTNVASAAFYPLFPISVSIVRFISFNTIDVLTAGQIVNTISVWFIIAALIVISKKLLSTKNKFWLVAVLLSAPTAFFLHVFYSEALFMALGFWAYIFAFRHKWLYMGILLSILSCSRLPSLLVIGLCGLEFMRSYKWNIKSIFNKKLLYFLLAPIGFIAYGLYLLKTRGDFFAMFHAYQATNDWSYQLFDINIIKTIIKITYQVFLSLIGQRVIDNDIVFNHLLPVIAIFTLIFSSIYLLTKNNDKYKPLGIIGLVSVVMFSLNGNLVSVHRYVLPCLTIYIALLLIIKGDYRKIILSLICVSGFVIQMILYYLFISYVFVG